MFKKKVFRNRDFMLLWAGQLVSRMGNSIHSIAMSWYVYELTGSTLAMGASILTSWLPQGLISPFAGVFVDKHDRKKIVVASDVISGLLVLGLFAVALNGALNLTTILIFNVLMSITATFFGPAVSAATQAVLTEDEYQDSNSLNQISDRTSYIVGAFLGGLLLAKVGLQYLLLVNGVSFLLSAFSECFIRVPVVRKNVKEKKSLGSSLKPALEFLITHRVYLVVVLFAGVIANGLFMSLSLYMPAIFKDVLHKGSTELGMYYSVKGALATLTSLYLLGTSKKFDPYKGILLMLLFEATALLAFGVTSNLYAFYAVSAFLGLAGAACSIMTATVRMMIVPNEMMGRISSFMGVLAAINVPFWTFLFGILGEVYQLQTIITFAGGFFFLSLVPACYVFAKEGKGFFAKEPSAEIAHEA